MWVVIKYEPYSVLGRHVVVNGKGRGSCSRQRHMHGRRADTPERRWCSTAHAGSMSTGQASGWSAAVWRDKGPCESDTLLNTQL